MVFERISRQSTHFRGKKPNLFSRDPIAQTTSWYLIQGKGKYPRRSAGRSTELAKQTEHALREWVFFTGKSSPLLLLLVFLFHLRRPGKSPHFSKQDMSRKYSGNVQAWDIVWFWAGFLGHTAIVRCFWSALLRSLYTRGPCWPCVFYPSAICGTFQVGGIVWRSPHVPEGLSLLGQDFSRPKIGRKKMEKRKWTLSTCLFCSEPFLPQSQWTDAGIMIKFLLKMFTCGIMSSINRLTVKLLFNQ